MSSWAINSEKISNQSGLFQQVDTGIPSHLRASTKITYQVAKPNFHRVNKPKKEMSFTRQPGTGPNSWIWIMRP